MKTRTIAVFLLLALVAGRVGAEDPSSRFDSFLSPGNSASLSVLSESGRHGDPDVLDRAARGSLLARKTETDTWTVTGRASRTELSDPLFIPRDNIFFPDDLWDLQAGVNFRRKLGVRRQWGVNGAVGSASDDPFHSIHETELQATGSALVPSGVRNSWLFLLSYSNNRTFANGVPLPGFAYIARSAEKRWQVIVGFPFALVSFTPDDDWALRASLFGPNTQSVDLSRRIAGEFRLYTAFERGAQAWFRAGRGTRSDRLIYQQRKAVLGLRGPLAWGLSLDAFGGRSFGRRFFEAKDVGSSDTPRVHLGNSWLMGLALSGRWGA